WYVLTMQERGVPRQAVVQVTDLAVYATVTATRTLAWVNDLATKAPLEGARVGLLGTSLGRTDGDGLVVAPTPARMLARDDDPGAPIVITRAAARGAFAPIMGERACEKCGIFEWERANPWWVVFQPDRYAYRPTDTLHAWGVVRDRESLDVPDRVTVRLLSEWDEMEGDVIPIAVKRVEPDASGAFLAPLELRDLPYGSYQLEVVVGDSVVASREISVDRIVKPAWTLSLRTNRHALLSGQTVRVSADARFFDGTPVAGAVLRFTGGAATRRATTGLLGRATAQVRMGPASDEPEEQWGIHAIDVHPANPEEGAIQADTHVAVFRANVLAKVAATVDGARLSATGSVHRVAWSRFARPGDRSLWDIDPLGPALGGRSVRVRVVEHHDIRFQTGTEYDFITKQTVPVFEYRTERREVYDNTLRTDATGTFRIGVDVNPVDRSFTVTVTATDADGRRTRAVDWASSADDDEGYSAPAISRDGGDPDDNRYEVGDEVRLRFEPGNGAPAAGTYLWTASQAGLREWQLTDSARMRMPFGEDSVPGIVIDAVRFTGTGYEAAWQPYLAAFDPADRRLTVRVTPDAKRYEPGDTASLAIRTTRPDGTPADATVLVRVLDEKLYAMGLADDEDPLTALYEPIGSGIIATGWTHGIDSDWGDGWGDTTGGGGDRAEFRDWLLATLVRTGEDGRARVPVELSDDITSWHVTAAGVSTRLEAGIGTASMPVGLPFFAEATIAPEYLAADRPVIAIRGFGSALGTGNTVTFRISSDTLPMAPVTVKAKAFLPAEVALPKLSAGTHRVRIVATTTAAGTARRDVLVRTFQVVPARQVRTVIRTIALTGATPVERGVGPTTLIVADGGRGRVVPVLDELRWADPARADRALAAALAVRLLRDELGLDVAEVAALQGDMGRFQADDGVAVVPWASGELPLTVLAAMADDPRMSARSLAGYFEPREVDPDDEGPAPEPMTPERQAWTLAGRAASGSMVLSEVRALAAAGQHSVPTRVALALAALLAGDEELAGRIERDVLAGAGFRMGPWVALDTGDEERDAVLTARLAIVAAGLADPLAPDMDAFVGANPPATTTVDLERALAAKAWISRTPAADASALLVVDGERRALEIEASRPRLVTLTPAQARTASIEPAGGTVVVTTTTTVAYRTGTLDRPEGLRLSVQVRPITVDADDLVIVTYTARLPRKPDGCWVLTDMVPSGLMPIGGAGNAYEDEEEEADRDWVFRPDSVTGQEVRFCLYVDPDRGRTVKARYVARVVTPGRYRWEPAVLQSGLATELGTATPRRTLTIGRLTR
ncbi:MAG TPA: alpha-2-macroglobulin family protein, partial [Candidatus Limnocylindrales bacterium]|nr:alpha-2-macroglobulin family protein [Candidatus Limnocylindrales bacterium]